MNLGLRFKEIGNSGLRAFSGYVREDFLNQLIGRQGASIYREMLDNSPTIGSVMFAILGVMRKAQWRTEPANDSPEAQEAADFADSLRFDMEDTWEDFVAEALSMLGYGYAPHEICYKRRNGPKPFEGTVPSSRYDDGKIGWSHLPIRGQDTILRWYFDPNGKVTGITQQPWTGPLVDIPGEKLLLFRPTAYKNNPEGRSILRNSYRSYFFIKRLEEQEAVLFERMSGLPIITVPNSLLEAAKNGDANAQSALTMYQNIVANIRIDEQMGLVLPSDPFPGLNGPSNVPMYGFKLETPGGGKTAIDADKTITRHKLDIMTSVLCDFLTMGHSSRGAQNLAETKVDLVMQAIEAWLNAIAAVMNRQALPRIWELNGLDRNLMPEYVPDMAQRIDLDTLGNFVLRLSQAGMPMFPDKDLEDYVREAGGLPDASEDDAERVLQEQQAGISHDTDDPNDPKYQAPIQVDPNKLPPKGSANKRQTLERSIKKMWARQIVKGNWK